MKKIVSLAFILAIAYCSFAQNLNVLSEYKSNDVPKIFSENSITYYGWDFRKTLLNDRNFLDEIRISSRILSEWVRDLEENNFNRNRIERIFKKKDYSYDGLTLQKLNKNLSDDNLLDMDRNAVNIDTIKNIVKDYKIEGEGLGLIFIGVEVSKEKLLSIAYATIFDKSSKEIIYACKIGGSAGKSYGLVNYYGIGFADVMKQFDMVIYNLKEQVRSFEKQKKSVK